MKEEKKETRTRILLLVILLLSASICVFGFTYLIKTQFNDSFENYFNPAPICINLVDEEACFAQDSCEGIYGPSCPTCDDLEFKYCQKVSLKNYARIENQRELCRNTGGEWYKNRLGNFCLCKNGTVKMIFDAQDGCVIK